MQTFDFLLRKTATAKSRTGRENPTGRLRTNLIKTEWKRVEKGQCDSCLDKGEN